jgi:hypothetical protein
MLPDTFYAAKHRPLPAGDPPKIPYGWGEIAGSDRSPSEPCKVSCSEDDFLDTFDNARKWFSVPSNGRAYLIRRRWPDGIVRCPRCGSQDVRYLALRELWDCKARHLKSQFSIRSGTILEDSRISLGLWLAAIWMVANAPPPSSRELALRLGITQNSACSMLRRIKCGRHTAGDPTCQPAESVRDAKSRLHANNDSCQPDVNKQYHVMTATERLAVRIAVNRRIERT